MNFSIFPFFLFFTSLLQIYFPLSGFQTCFSDNQPSVWSYYSQVKYQEVDFVFSHSLYFHSFLFPSLPDPKLPSSAHSAGALPSMCAFPYRMCRLLSDLYRFLSYRRPAFLSGSALLPSFFGRCLETLFEMQPACSAFSYSSGLFFRGAPRPFSVLYRMPVWEHTSLPKPQEFPASLCLHTDAFV